MDDTDVLDAKGSIAWWRDANPESAHAKYLTMHGSDTNRSKIAVSQGRPPRPRGDHARQRGYGRRGR